MVARIVSEQARRKTAMDVNAKLDMCGNAQNHSGHSFILHTLKSEHEELWKELAWKMHYIFRRNPHPR